MLKLCSKSVPTSPLISKSPRDFLLKFLSYNVSNSSALLPNGCLLTLVMIKKSIRSNDLFRSVGQYVGDPADIKSKFHSFLNTYVLILNLFRIKSYHRENY